MDQMGSMIDRQTGWTGFKMPSYSIRIDEVREMHPWKNGLEALESMLRGNTEIPHTSSRCIDCHLARLRRRLHALQTKPAQRKASFKKKNTRQYRKKQKAMKPGIIRRQIRRLQCQLQIQLRQEVDRIP